MEHQPSETILEEEYLKKTLEEARRQHSHTRDAIEEKLADMTAVKKDIFENTEHHISNLWSSDGFEALVELSQSVSPVTEITADCEELQRNQNRLELFLKSPYFARVDFCFDGEEMPEKIYIGRISLRPEHSVDQYVYDWRSPIASVFYRFMTGRAFYQAPAGEITGEIVRKRQYEIRDSQLRYFFDTDMSISDEILKQLLSGNTSPKMKTIVETIQREQDIAIRNMENDLLMIQGVAGSGKTSIALHRAAYLMYQGLQARLNANNILIISPNTAFEQYISDVLPELGEEQVVSMVFEDMVSAVLPGRTLQPQACFLEKAVSSHAYRELVKSSMEFKTSGAFLQLLNQFASDLSQRRIDFPDVRTGAHCVSKESMKPDLCDLYRQLWKDASYFEENCPETPFSEKIHEIRTYTLENLESGTVYFDDAPALLYLHLKIHGSRSYQNIRQVIIDEAQDYYPLQFEIFHLLFPNAKYTILGDINQTLSKEEDLTFYSSIRKILKKQNAALLTLDKSFRCTNEILQFGLQFISRRPEISSFNRSGEPVTAAAFPEHEDYLRHIVQEIRHCKEKGFGSVCLICKTEENCSRLYADLRTLTDVRQITGSAAEPMQGNILMPSYLTKGLEFDAVIICDADDENYRDDDDKKLLYIECTRALHRLSLCCEGRLSKFIRKSVSL